MVLLSDTKNYLKVDFEDDDSLIENFIQQAQIYIDACCGTKYKEYEDKIKLSELLIKKIVSDLYENRELYLDNKKSGYDKISSTILDILANCGDSDD